MDTPKSMGKRVGEVLKSGGKGVEVKTAEELHNGDGLCYIENGELKGFNVNSVSRSQLRDVYLVKTNDNLNLKPETVLFRNFDKSFTDNILNKSSKRKIEVMFKVIVNENNVIFSVNDEENNTVFYKSDNFQKAENPKQLDILKDQLKKCGNTIFECIDIEFEGDFIPFFKSSEINEIRRTLLDDLLLERKESYSPVRRQNVNKFEISEPIKSDWKLNVVNSLSSGIYENMGVYPEKGVEITNVFKEKEVMTCKYCILFEIGKCLKTSNVKQPIYLSNKLTRYKLDFDCNTCFMKVIASK